MVSVIKKWLRSTYDLLMFPLGEALNVLPDRLFFVAVNAQLFMKGSPARFSASSRPRAFVAQSDNLSHYFLHRDRGRQFYAQGLKARAKQIGGSYCLDQSTLYKMMWWSIAAPILPTCFSIWLAKSRLSNISLLSQRPENI